MQSVFGRKVLIGLNGFLLILHQHSINLSTSLKISTAFVILLGLSSLLTWCMLGLELWRHQNRWAIEFSTWAKVRLKGCVFLVFALALRDDQMQLRHFRIYTTI